MSEQKPAYPAHTQKVHGDEDDGPHAQPDHMVVYDDEDNQPLVHSVSKKKLRKKGVTQLLMTETWHPWCLQHLRSAKEKGTASMARPNCRTGTEGVKRLA